MKFLSVIICNYNIYDAVQKCPDSMNVGKGSQLGKHGCGSLINLTWTCHHDEDLLLQH